MLDLTYSLQHSVCQGCDQYSLTREQLKQKEDKRERTREYQIVRSYSGYWFPLSQVSSCCCTNLTNSTALSRAVGCAATRPARTNPASAWCPAVLSGSQGGSAIFQFTINTLILRWKKYWLYGELVQIKSDESSKVRFRILMRRMPYCRMPVL